ncbi:hypothetical protein EVAR_16552_1 [Eumeta japonica]|uniref:Uncharacterized protein n=1 Tax=Eumeta variegata TaxID=151549 RepID=A0A4C1U325_EUMVA|nr:hypothetical protein EVAR_16552_1 [Eumeta japonica]
MMVTSAGPSFDRVGTRLFLSFLNAPSYVAPRATAPLALPPGGADGDFQRYASNIEMQAMASEKKEEKKKQRERKLEESAEGRPQ